SFLSTVPRPPSPPLFPYTTLFRSGELGLPAVPASKPAHRRTARLTRTLRTRWWPRFLLAGALLVIVSVTLLSGAAAAWVGISGAAIITVTVFRAASMKPDEYRYEPPVPPGGTSG